ncbi:RbsD/FucU family protein [Jannaschia sp. M317]|uniref:RbsD/FucU family protein n=1 Tax=Jannaschia sp. M317 TaxID=2867011 RepID=UPI0021A7108A|nr:RbsD/FucU domain-containing protein [Jannaschia sp. M317]UWQ19931.1 ribose ABC transporter [Jannaschia sp. M317]
MLIGIDPILPPDLLHVLAQMGHGDELAIVDANFPGHGTHDRVIRMDGCDAVQVLRAVLTLFPLDQFDEANALSMAVVGDPDTLPEAVAAFQAEVDAVGGPVITPLERFAFYARARQCFAIAQTGERRLYGNIIIKKGVIE